MKAPENRPAKVGECFDALEEHGWNLAAVAGLLELCGELGGSAAVSARLVGKAGFVLCRELERLEATVARLHKELAR